MPEGDQYQQQADEYSAQITGWKNVNLTGELKDRTVILIQRAFVVSRSKGSLEVVKGLNMCVYIWAGDIDSKQKQEFLANGYLNYRG